MHEDWRTGDYSPDAVLTLEIIDSAQRAGFSLDQIRHLLPAGEGSWNHKELLEALKAKVSEIDQLQRHLKESKAQLLVAIKSVESRPEGITCSDNKRRVAEQLRREGVVSTRRTSARDR
jgi:DNA-binding transcriptional MerR regulator